MATRRETLTAELKALELEELTEVMLDLRSHIQAQHGEQLGELLESLEQGRRGEYTEVQVKDLRAYLADLAS